MTTKFTSLYDTQFYLLKQRNVARDTASNQSGYNEAVDGNNTGHDDWND